MSENDPLIDSDALLMMTAMIAAKLAPGEPEHIAKSAFAIALECELLVKAEALARRDASHRREMVARMAPKP